MGPSGHQLTKRSAVRCSRGTHAGGQEDGRDDGARHGRSGRGEARGRRRTVSDRRRLELNFGIRRTAKFGFRGFCTGFAVGQSHALPVTLPSRGQTCYSSSRPARSRGGQQPNAPAPRAGRGRWAAQSRNMVVGSSRPGKAQACMVFLLLTVADVARAPAVWRGRLLRSVESRRVRAGLCSECPATEEGQDGGGSGKGV